MQSKIIWHEKVENVKGNFKGEDNQGKNPEMSQMLELLVKIFKIVYYNRFSRNKGKILEINEKKRHSNQNDRHYREDTRVMIQHMKLLKLCLPMDTPNQ